MSDGRGQLDHVRPDQGLLEEAVLGQERLKGREGTVEYEVLDGPCFAKKRNI